MKTRFAFGKTGIEVSVPAGFDSAIVESRSAEPLPDVAMALSYALDHPQGSPSLVELAQGKKKVVIVVCDITRPAPNAVTLPPLLERLHHAGIAPDGITILIATGLHRAATPAEIDHILGPSIAKCYTVVSNDARATGQHRDLGTTVRGTPIFIHKDFADADLRITLGFIEQHLMAGFSGGRKLVAPGVAAEATIKVIHSPRFMREPLATEGSIAGNPLHDELLEIARIAQHDFMLDVTLTRNRQISGVFAGNPVLAHETGVRFLQQTGLQQIDGPADLVITSAAGFPLDLTFYQSVKAITAAQHLIKPGGRILVIAECAEGVGSAEFSTKLKTMRSFETFLSEIAHAPVMIDQWQLEKLALVGRSSSLFFCAPGVKSEDLGSLQGRHFSRIELAIAAATAGLPARSRILLIPEGPYAFAKIADSVA